MKIKFIIKKWNIIIKIISIIIIVRSIIKKGELDLMTKNYASINTFVDRMNPMQKRFQ